MASLSILMLDMNSLIVPPLMSGQSSGGRGTQSLGYLGEAAYEEGGGTRASTPRGALHHDVELLRHGSETIACARVGVGARRTGSVARAPRSRLSPN